MKRLLKIMYMALIHPVFFFKYTTKKASAGFVLKGIHHNIKIKKIEIGKKVEIGDYCRINQYGLGSLKIGNGCYFGHNNSFLIGDDIIIGNDVLMASHILITSENHSMDPISTVPYKNQPLVCAPITIGSGCWIGERVVILPGVRIGEKCIIGAGSIVTKSIPDYCIAAGNPAKVLKEYDFQIKEWVKK